MNQAHIHLLLNHLPVVGTLFSVLLVAVAMVRKNDELRKVSLGFVVLVALAAVPTYLTGEPAEKIVEHLPGVSDALIESHEDSALFSLVAVEVAGMASLTGLFIFRRRSLPNAMVATALAITLIAAGLMGWTANLGGQIRHTEIRSGFTAPAENGKGETEGHLKEAGERERH